MQFSSYLDSVRRRFNIQLLEGCAYQSCNSFHVQHELRGRQDVKLIYHYDAITL